MLGPRARDRELCGHREPRISSGSLGRADAGDGGRGRVRAPPAHHGAPDADAKRFSVELGADHVTANHGRGDVVAICDAHLGAHHVGAHHLGAHHLGAHPVVDYGGADSSCRDVFSNTPANDVVADPRSDRITSHVRPHPSADPCTYGSNIPCTDGSSNPCTDGSAYPITEDPLAVDATTPNPDRADSNNDTDDGDDGFPWFLVALALAVVLCMVLVLSVLFCVRSKRVSEPNSHPSFVNPVYNSHPPANMTAGTYAAPTYAEPDALEGGFGQSVDPDEPEL